MSIKRGFASRLLDGYAALVLLYLFIPIGLMVVFSFNQPLGQRNYAWHKFSLNAWKDPFKYPELKHAFLKSLQVGAIATLIAVTLGTLMALALVKYRFKGKGVVNTLIVLPLTMPEIVMGFSLLTLFVNLRWTTGFWTIVIAHVMFCVSYVATTVKARIRGFDWRLEEAAADLGAGPIRTFRKVTLPIIAPGVFAAALLTFALSLDDFTVTYFNSGKVRTFPVEVFTQKRSRVPAQIDVFGTMILLAAATIAVLGVLVERRRSRLGR